MVQRRVLQCGLCRSKEKCLKPGLRKWRTTKAEYRRIDKNKKSSTPPASGRTSPVRVQRGRPKVPYHRRKAYMMISQYNAALESAEAKSHKYKMRWL